MVLIVPIGLLCKIRCIFKIDKRLFEDRGETFADFEYGLLVHIETYCSVGETILTWYWRVLDID